MDARTTANRGGPNTDAVVRDLAAGAIAGTVATFAMSAVMLTAQKIGLLGQQPPRRLSDVVLDEVTGGRATEPVRRFGTAIVHLGIGAAGAAVHQAGRGMLSRPQPALAWGAGFGALFWAVNYGLVAPAIHLLPPPHRDRPGRPPVMLAANVVWGGLSSFIGDRLSRRFAQA